MTSLHTEGTPTRGGQRVAYADGLTEGITMSDEAKATEVTTDPKVDQGGQSGNFTPPATQADLDRIIADRLSRERAKFADYDEMKAKAAEYDKVAEASKSELERERDARQKAESERDALKAAQQIADWKTEVSKETGVPASVLAGTTKEEIEAHAETLKPLIENSTALQPIPGEGKETPTPLNGDGIEGALRSALGIK